MASDLIESPTSRARAMSSRGRTGRGVSEREGQGGQTQGHGVADPQDVARRASGHSSGRAIGLIGGIASPFNATRGGGKGAISEIPINGGRSRSVPAFQLCKKILTKLTSASLSLLREPATIIDRF